MKVRMRSCFLVSSYQCIASRIFNSCPYCGEGFSASNCMSARPHTAVPGIQVKRQPLASWHTGCWRPRQRWTHYESDSPMRILRALCTRLQCCAHLEQLPLQINQCHALVERDRNSGRLTIRTHTMTRQWPQNDPWATKLRAELTVYTIPNVVTVGTFLLIYWALGTNLLGLCQCWTWLGIPDLAANPQTSNFLLIVYLRRTTRFT